MNSSEASYRKERIDRGIKVRSESIYIVSSYRELLYTLLPRVLPIAGLLILPLVLGTGYGTRILMYSCIYALLALSWDFLASIGMISLGQAFFFGVGSYLAGALNYYFGLPPLITIPVAAIGGGVVCAGLLAPVVRLKGIYFAMITLVYPLLFLKVIEATHILGGSHGLPGLTVFEPYAAAYITIPLLIICLFGFRRIISEDYGIILLGIGENEQTVMSGGINIHWYKVQAVFIAAAAGSLAGAIATHYFGFVGMSAFALEFSILPIAGAIIGGVGTFAGAALGTFILVPLSEFLRDFGGLRIVLYSLLLAGAVILLPEGIFHYLQRKYQQFERWVRF